MNIVTRLIRAYQAQSDYKRFEERMWRSARHQKRLPDIDLLNRVETNSSMAGILSPQEYKTYSTGRIVERNIWGTNEPYEENMLSDGIKALEALATSEDIILHMDTFIEEMHRLQSQIQITLSYTKDYDDRKQCMKLGDKCNAICSAVEKRVSDIRWSIFDRTETLLQMKCPPHDVRVAVQDFEELLRLKDMNLGAHKRQLWDYLSSIQEIEMLDHFCLQTTSLQEAVKVLNDFILPLRTDEVRFFSRVELICLQMILAGIREMQCP